jgi:nicotinate phosphoribosyltransferase
MEYLSAIVFDIGGEYFERYIQDIEYRADEYKSADIDGIILEAAFRRAPSFQTAVIGSNKALEAGWAGTSNVSIMNTKTVDKIGGTMAHAFVMSYQTELEAFQKWNQYFPNSTILVDTYDTINAVNMLIDNNIKPKDIRIDSGDFFSLVVEVRNILDNAGWNDVGIFISGDITPELLIKMRNHNIPFDKSMAGTYYIYCNELIRKVNAGFVYKIVEFVDENNNIIYPEKKAEGKKNYTGIKDIKFKDNKAIVSKNKSDTLDISVINQFNIDTSISFV